MVREKVFKVISQVMNHPLDQVTEQSSVENVEKWDSLQHINLVLALEESFNIKFNEDEIVHMISAAEILEILKKKGIQ